MTKSDPILLTLFANRFMSVAEAMGRSLRQTSISTNIKERLDFSCALFAPDGDLVANAPYIPIHLGSMSFAVKYQMQLHAGTLKDGDVFMTNSPHAGGSHLPDITIITPVFADTGDIIFFTASRGHHADIGGILPGSMPPTSVSLAEEGAEIVSFKIVDGGVFDQQGLYEYMVDKPAQHPGSSGCRNIRDVESDLKAQIAANYKGVQLIRAIVDEYGLETVQEYMHHIRVNAENSVRTLLVDVAKRVGNVLTSVDYLDDGSPIQLRVEIDKESGSAVFDFAGTGCEVRGNLNAPISVVHSAVIYCMRAMLDVDIPLNAGCLVPLDVRIPQGSLLSPSRTAAVCGGNVLTSQRIVDVVLKAFRACAASQGCTNNVTFGTGGKTSEGVAVSGWGYYETIAGGSGAGPGWHGTSGVHTHITNTRIGDVEILERRYPVLVHRFGLRAGSGGDGQWQGGDGVVREFEVTHGLQVSILSERRARAPYGMEGGGAGQMGQNTWIRHEDGPRHVNVGGKATIWMTKGDRLVLLTPGGGGWGAPSAESAGRAECISNHITHFAVVGGGVPGLAAAWALAAAGHSVVVVEQQSARCIARSREGVRSMPSMTQMFTDWGIDDKLALISTQINQMHLLDGKSGEELGLIAIDKVMDNLPANFLSVQYGALFRLFYDLAVERGVHLVFDCQVVDLDPWQGTITCKDGRQFTADIIIGADGTNSIVRPVVLGSSAPLPEYDNMVTVFLVAPADVARQDDDLADLLKRECWTAWFADDCSMHGVLTGPGPGYDYFLVMNITVHDQHIRDDFPLSFESLGLHLFEPRAQKLLKLSHQLQKIAFAHYPPFDNWVHESGKVVLVGEAAHPMIPSGSHDTVTGIEDAMTLSMLFSLPATKHQTPILLSIYEELRQPRCASVQRYLRRKREVATIPHGPGQRRRDALLRNQRSFHQGDELDDEFLYATYMGFVQVYGFNAREAVQDWWVKLGRSIFTRSEDTEQDDGDAPTSVPDFVDAEVERDGPAYPIISDPLMGEDEDVVREVEACRRQQ